MNKESNQSHDLNAHLSTLYLALNMIKEDWRKNPDSVSQVIDLSIEKLQTLKEMLRQEHLE